MKRTKRSMGGSPRDADSLTRRRLLRASVATVVAVFGAGCVNDGERRSTSSQVSIVNTREDDVRVYLTITHLDEFQETISTLSDLPAGGTDDYPDAIPELGSYHIDISIRDGPADTFEWEANGTDLVVEVTEDGFQFEQMEG